MSKAQYLSFSFHAKTLCLKILSLFLLVCQQRFLIHISWLFHSLGFLADHYHWQPRIARQLARCLRTCLGCLGGSAFDLASQLIFASALDPLGLIAQIAGELKTRRLKNE